ncbi:MAG: hypothetical protein WA705_02315 [Candidatus Ozemobacteraceae bacterium]
MAGMNEKEPFETYLRENFSVKPPSDALLDRLEKRAQWRPQPRGGPGPFLLSAGFVLGVTMSLALFLYFLHSTPQDSRIQAVQEVPQAIPLSSPPVIHVALIEDSVEAGSTFYSRLLSRNEPSFSFDLSVAPGKTQDSKDVL